MEAEAAVPQLQSKGEKLSKQLVLEEQVRFSYSESFGLSVIRPKPCLRCDAQVPLELQKCTECRAEAHAADFAWQCLSVPLQGACRAGP